MKGETFEAVLLVLKSKGIGPFYRTMLGEGKSATDHEELRIAYFGFTRPRKILCLAVSTEADSEGLG